MADAPGWIDMDALTPLFEGRTRVVYGIRGHPGLLLKLESPVRAAKIENRKGWRYATKRWSLKARFSYIEREYDTYIRAMFRAAGLGRVPPLPRPCGLVLTDAGLGALVRKVRDANGDPAPTLREVLAEQGQTGELIDALNVLVREIRDFHIPVHDLSPDNVVWETRKGRRRFVLIDGFGDKTWIPMGRYLPRLNDRRLARQCREAADALGLSFDSARFQFSAPEAPVLP